MGGGATSDHETSDAEIGDVETDDEGASEIKMKFLRGLVILPQFRPN